MMKSLVCAALFLPCTTWACLNVDGYTLSGQRRSREGVTIVKALRETMAQAAGDPEIGRRLLGSAPVDNKEARAVKQILAGKLDESIALLTQIEQDTPGRYSTASNLGTAYELKGDVPNALKWIEEGLRRKPASHYGTEWVHLLILKAKAEAAINPGQPLRPLLHVPETLSAATPIVTGDQSHTAEEVENAISYQLRERLVFVKPKDRLRGGPAVPSCPD